MAMDVLLAGLERCAYGVNASNDALESASIFLKICSPMRAMMRMLTTAYGESVSCTPI
jgi:hypothetical protein